MMIENRTQLGDVGHLKDVQPLLSSPGNDIVGHHGVPSVEKHFMNRQPSLVSLQIEHEGESFHSILHEVKKLFELSSALVIS